MALLGAREIRGRRIVVDVNANFVKEGARGSPRVVGTGAGVLDQRQLDVFNDRDMPEQRRALEHYADASAHTLPVGVRRACRVDRRAVDRHRAARGGFEPEEVTDEQGLPGVDRAKDDDGIAVRDAERDVAYARVFGRAGESVLGERLRQLASPGMK